MKSITTIIVVLVIALLTFSSPGAALAATPTPGASTSTTQTLYLPMTTQSGTTGAPSQRTANQPMHAVRIDYGNMATSRDVVDTMEQQLKKAGTTMVALGAGRPEWSFFKWTGYEQYWANDVKDSGIDYLMEDAQRFGKWAHVDAVVDVFAPNYIKDHPDKAAINFLGVQNPYLVNTMELVDGELGQRLLAMIEAIARDYPVDSVSITELMYHRDGYGPAEKAAYLAYTGRSDWPRNSKGQIDIDEPSIGQWRSYELGRFFQKAAAITHKYGKEFFMDVDVSWGHLQDATRENGTQYDTVLKYADKIVVWAYYDIANYPPEYLTELAKSLVKYGTDKVILSVGLWNSTETAAITPDSMRKAILASEAGGMPNVWITPTILMTDQHWQVLYDLWGAKS